MVNLNRSRGVISAFLRYVTPALIFACAALLSPEADAADSYKLAKNNISSDGRDRSYSYFVSSKADRRGFNYVIYALHDNGQTAEQFAEQSGWMKVAEDNGFIVVFPEGANKTWAPNSGAEDDYLKAVYDHASTHMVLPPGMAPPPPGGNRGAAEGEDGG